MKLLWLTPTTSFWCYSAWRLLCRYETLRPNFEVSCVLIVCMEMARALTTISQVNPGIALKWLVVVTWRHNSQVSTVSCWCGSVFLFVCMFCGGGGGGCWLHPILGKLLGHNFLIGETQKHNNTSKSTNPKTPFTKKLWTFPKHSKMFLKTHFGGTTHILIVINHESDPCLF